MQSSTKVMGLHARKSVILFKPHWWILRFDVFAICFQTTKAIICTHVNAGHWCDTWNSPQFLAIHPVFNERTVSTFSHVALNFDRYDKGSMCYSAIVGKRSVEHPWAARDYEVQFSQKSSFHRMFLMEMPGIDPRYLAHANRALYHLSYTPMWAKILPRLRIFNIYSLLYCFQQQQCGDEDWSAGHC